jgi:hypothetical protein
MAYRTADLAWSKGLGAETKESTRKTEKKRDGTYKEGHERKKPK